MSQLFPRNLLEFERWFRTEEACRDYLIRVRWPDGMHCGHCRFIQLWKTGRGVFRCGGCRRELSVLAGTIFESSNLSLRVWFRAMWQMTNQKAGVSALGLQRTLGLGSYRTAWACLHKLRRAMVRPGRKLLNGEIEVDETFVGGHERNGGGRHVGKKSLVMIAAEIRGTGIGRIRLQPIPDTSKEHLLGFVSQIAAHGSTIVTDGLLVYGNLARMGFNHRPRVPPSRWDSTKLLPRVHRVAALLKRWLLGIHHGSFSKRQLAAYLDEFTFRFNRRLSSDRGMLFYRLLQQSAATEPVPFVELRKGG